MNNYTNDKFNLLNLKYMFIKRNIEIDYNKIVADKEIWVKRFWYFLMIMHTIDSKNRVNFDWITLSPTNLSTLLALFKRKWFLGQFKLKWDSVKTYYLNPLYAHKGKTITKELFDAFDKINEWKVY